MTDWSAWLGRETVSHDIAAVAPVRRLAATIDRDRASWPAGVLPPLGHWLFHLPDAPTATLGPDGHPRRGALLPPLPQPRRMWAGGRLRFHAPIPFGAAMARTSRVEEIVAKSGSSGDMVFVTMAHSITADGQRAVEEVQDLVYLAIAPPAAPREIDRPAAETSRSMVADPAMLFRYSALTFNAHRIHYDLAYARDVECYPALVVHGPLQATLLIDHALRDGVAPAAFRFRGTAPLYADRPFTLNRAGDELWVADDTGQVTMTATVERSGELGADRLAVGA